MPTAPSPERPQASPEIAGDQDAVAVAASRGVLERERTDVARQPEPLGQEDHLGVKREPVDRGTGEDLAGRVEAE